MSLQLGHERTDRLSTLGDLENIRLSKESRFSRLVRWLFGKKNSLLIFVVFPSIIAGIYYGLIASSQYVAEMRMIVRTIGVSEKFDSSETREGRSMIGGDSLTQDSYIVANYLKSPEIVRQLDAEINLRAYFSADEIDPLSRLGANASFEELVRFWGRHIDTYVDGPSGIIILTIRAFSPEQSVLIGKAALSSANAMIDKISERAKNDLVSRVEGDVNASLGEYRVALDELRDYQNKTGILDPLSSAKMVSEIIGKLTEQKLQLLVSLKSLEAANADNTARGRELRRSIQAIDDQIKLRQDSMAGAARGGEAQLSSSLTEFSRLETRRIVTQAIYEANVRNFDTAKSTALKRTTFMSIFSNSQLPEESEYPKRFSNWIILTIGLFTFWMTATLVWMSVEDHRV